jgi:hypothetical protein
LRFISFFVSFFCKFQKQINFRSKILLNFCKQCSQWSKILDYCVVLLLAKCTTGSHLLIPDTDICLHFQKCYTFLKNKHFFFNFIFMLYHLISWVVPGTTYISIPIPQAVWNINSLHMKSIAHRHFILMTITKTALLGTES